jgi:hypothetical protein
MQFKYSRALTFLSSWWDYIELKLKKEKYW